MKKVKLLTSLAAFVLVLGLGACEVTEEETPDEGGETTETSDTTETGDTGEGGETGDTDTDLDGYALVGTFEDSSWDSKPSVDSKYYIPLDTTEYEVTVTMSEAVEGTDNAKFRIVEWGDSWDLVAGYDDLAEGSTGVIGEGDAKNIKVNWGATYDLTITLGDTPSILVTIQTEEEDVQEVHLLGSFDFSANEADGTGVSSSTDLDDFWYGEDLYLGVREYSSVYLGNGTGGQFPNVTTLLKIGTASGSGSIQLKFALGTCISEVVVTAHSWNTSTTNALTINGISENTTNSGTAEEITYEITDDFTYLVTMETAAAVTVHSIAIYGTYEPDRIEPITGLTLTADASELNVGESAHVSVSYEPDTTVFDLNTLTWESDNTSVATVTKTTTGATITAVGSGEATITATAENGIGDSITITVNDVLQDSETFVSSELGYGNSDDVEKIDGHQVTIAFAKGTYSGLPKYYTSGTAIRVYGGNIITFTAKYEEATISSIVLTCQSSKYTGSTLTCTNCTSSLSDTVITLTPTDDYDPADQEGYQNLVLSPSGSGDYQLRITQFVINYSL